MQCLAITQEGIQCSRSRTTGNFCKQHTALLTPIIRIPEQKRTLLTNPFSPYVIYVSLAQLKEQKIPESKQFHYYCGLFWKYSMHNEPRSATIRGYPGLNHLWSDRSLEAIVQHKVDMIEWHRIGMEFDRKLLSEEDQISYDLLVVEFLQKSITEVPDFHGRLMPITAKSGLHLLSSALDLAPSKTVQDYKDRISRLQKFPTLVEQTIVLMTKGLEMKITPSQITMHGIPDQVRAIMNPNLDKNPFFRSFTKLPGSFSAEEKKTIIEEATKAIQDTFPTTRRFLNFLVDTYIPNCCRTISRSDLPDGKRWYQECIRCNITLPLNVDEIYNLGLSEVKKIRTQIEVIQKRLNYGSREAMMKDLSENKRFFHQSKEDLLAEFRSYKDEFYPKLRRLFKRFPKIDFNIEPVPEHLEKSVTAGSLRVSSLEQGRPSVFYVNTYDLTVIPKWRMKPLFLHEVMPGHHYQLSLSQESTDIPEFRKYYSDTAFVQGWAVYCETLGYELGIYTDTYSELGQLVDEMKRAVRLVVDTGIHSRGMTREEAIRYYMNEVMSSEHEATSQINRYISCPGQALSYKIGQLTFTRLRHHAEQELGHRFDIREFHDLILSAGTLPLNLLERIVNSWIEKQQSSAL